MDQICPKREFLDENEKSEQHHWILHIRTRPATKFQLKLTILTFWSKSGQKGYPRSKTENRHWILYIRITLGIKFHLKLTTSIVWTKFPQKEYFLSEQKKWTPPLNSAYWNYSGYQISAWTDNFDFMDQIFPNQIFPV